MGRFLVEGQIRGWSAFHPGERANPSGPAFGGDGRPFHVPQRARLQGSGPHQGSPKRKVVIIRKNKALRLTYNYNVSLFLLPLLSFCFGLQSYFVCVLSSRSLSFLNRYCTFQRNEPCALPVIVEMIAAYMKVPADQVAMATTINAIKLFGFN